MSGADIWAAAVFLIQQYRDPEIVAARRLDAVREAQLPTAAAAWKLILAAVKELQRDELQFGERVH